MKFRTQISIEPFGRGIDHSQRGLSAGSCFAGNIAAKMKRAKFNICDNPFGVMFNPESIARTLDALHAEHVFKRGDLVFDGGLWSSFDFHGSFSSADPEEALDRMNRAAAEGGMALREADYVIITFGTSWVYELEEDADAVFSGAISDRERNSGRTNYADAGFAAGRVVANCHRFPSGMFRRRRLGIGEITERYDRLLSTALDGKQVILTVSPVRHLKDGFAGNSAGKAVLLLAAEALAERHDNVDYFPSYEIMTDDLRDYRFYCEDMVHPSPTAVDYIWELFCGTAMTRDAAQAAKEAEKIAEAAEHRPVRPDSESFRNFAGTTVKKIEELRSKYPAMDFSAELRHFEELLKI